jgi:putative hydrolase of the HAD superfamily
MDIRGIFFDAADVLYERPEPTDSYVSSLLQEKGHSIELSMADQGRQKALRSETKRGRLSPDVYWDQLLLIYGVADPQERRTLVDKINGHSDNVLPIPGGRETLAGLKKRGFLLGIVTDTIYPIERKMRWLDKVGVAEFIDVVACSTVLGAHKPDLAIYLSAVQQAGLTPSESAFVGHHAGEIEGARKAGLATVAVNYDPDARADYYAQSLPDLLNVPIFEQSNTQKVKGMNHDIKVIFIDVGATLRYLVEDEPYQARARQQIAAFVGTDESPEAFCEKLDARYKVYRKWAFDTLLEAPERELWTRWMLPDWPAEKIAPLAGELTYLYRQTMGHRHAQPDAKDVVVELTRRGYRLGILSNTITEREIPEWLEEDGLSQYFPTVILSSIFGRRKPGPEIFWEAARVAGVDPARAAYVADNPSRDVPGSRRAGLGMVIIMGEPAALEKKDLTGENKPDLVIHTLSELLDIFPARHSPGDGGSPKSGRA